MANRSPFQIQTSPLPSGDSLTLNDFLELLPEQIQIILNEGFSTFVTGSVAPSTNEGPWLKNGTEWWVWSDSSGGYIPLVLEGTVRKTYVQSTAPTGTIQENELWIQTDGVQTVIESFIYLNGGWRTWVKSSLNIKKETYPVGTLYQNYTDSRNPSVILGMTGTTWVPVSDAAIAAFGGRLQL
jgi:hypothetical protein